MSDLSHPLEKGRGLALAAREAAESGDAAAFRRHFIDLKQYFWVGPGQEYLNHYSAVALDTSSGGPDNPFATLAFSMLAELSDCINEVSGYYKEGIWQSRECLTALLIVERVLHMFQETSDSLDTYVLGSENANSS
ncbi:MAG: hypothetical protein ABIH34_03290 [Nanoarchaeota archaeon]